MEVGAEGEMAEQRKETKVVVAEKKAAEEDGSEESEAEEAVEIAADSDDVEFVHARLKDMSVFSFLTHVRSLNLRRNLITRIAGLEPLTTLTTLELYDNQITEMAGLGTLVNLRTLDLSYNRIRRIDGLGALTQLRSLFLVSNKISEIRGLDALAQLRLLELGDNKIRKMEGLESLVLLEKLFLGKNKIRRLEGLGAQTALGHLSLQANRITKIENLDHLGGCLRELFVSENGLSAIGDGLGRLDQLQLLDLAVNFIPHIDGVAHLAHLTDFWFNDNKVADWAELGDLQRLPALKTIYMHGNPIERKGGVVGGEISPDYRRKMLLLFPDAARIDAIPTGPIRPPIV